MNRGLRPALRRSWRGAANLWKSGPLSDGEAAGSAKQRSWRGATLGDGFRYAGTQDRVLGALERVRALGADQHCDMEGFGHEFVALRVGGAAVSMGLGLDSIDAHLEFMREFMHNVAPRLDLPKS